MAQSEARQVFEAAFDGPTPGIGWRLGRIVAAMNPGKFVLDQVSDPFDLDDFVAASGRADATLDPAQHAELSTRWRRGHGLGVSPLNGGLRRQVGRARPSRRRRVVA